MEKQEKPFFTYNYWKCVLIIVFFIINFSTTFAKENEEILIKLKNNTDLIKYEIKNDNYEAEINDLYGDKLDFIEPNYSYQMAIIPSDSHFNNQWYLKRIKVVEAWDIVREAPEIVIAVLDSGIQLDHPDLKDNIWINTKEIPNNGMDDDKNGYIDDINGWDFVNNVADPSPKFNENYTIDGITHGTIVSGVLGGYGNNGTGISGVVWHTNIMSLKVLDDNGAGDTASVIKAIDYAIANDVDIINFSFIGYNNSRNLDQAIRRAHEAGIILVAAAGNDEGEGAGINLDDKPIYPACHDGEPGENMVIGVSATDTLDQKASFSGYGFRCIDIAAPGVSIFTTSVFSPDHSGEDKEYDKYYDGYWSGTSLATPMITGAAALVATANPALDKQGIQEILFKNSDNINRLNPNYLGKLGIGRINIYNSVKEAKEILAKTDINLVLALKANNESTIKITNHAGKKVKEFSAYEQEFAGGVNIAIGNIDGDDENEIITGAGFGGAPHIKIFNTAGEFRGEFMAYNQNFHGGVNVAVGDIDGDGKDEIVTGAGFTGGPHVRIFSAEGDLKHEFFAYNENFHGGVNVAVGDIDGDGKDEIVTGAGFTGGPHVRIFDASGRAEGGFFAYDKNFRGGVNVAIGTLNSGRNGKKQLIITGSGKSGGPHVRIFDNHAKVQGQFFAYHKKFKGGVGVSAEDVDQDGIDEIITSAGPGGAPHVRIFEKNGSLINSFYGFDSQNESGINANAIKINIIN